MSAKQVTPEQTTRTVTALMNNAFGTSSEEEDEKEEVGHEEDGGQQQMANYRFYLIFKLHFIFNY
jgi:hypothetical protein